MDFLELHYMTPRGAGVCRYLWDEESTLKAVKSLAKRHIEARLVEYQSREEAGSVEQTPEGNWAWWYWPGVFRSTQPGQPSRVTSQNRASDLAGSSPHPSAPPPTTLPALPGGRHS